MVDGTGLSVKQMKVFIKGYHNRAIAEVQLDEGNIAINTREAPSRFPCKQPWWYTLRETAKKRSCEVIQGRSFVCPGSCSACRSLSRLRRLALIRSAF